MEKMTCAAAKQLDLVEYLASLGHHPQKIRNQDYWFLSPLRDEKTASFKVNRHHNVCFDNGVGQGGKEKPKSNYLFIICRLNAKID